MSPFDECRIRDSLLQSKPPIIKEVATSPLPPPPPAPPKKAAAPVRRPSSSTSISSYLPYADMLKNMRKVPKDDGRGEQLEFCGRILSDLQHKQHQTLLRSRSLSYPNASKFFGNFKLMIRHCFLFNLAGTPVNQAGIELQRLFDDALTVEDETARKSARVVSDYSADEFEFVQSPQRRLIRY
ncbi:hypothetical protein P692DRAFT_20881006 [Suillus brevipes Sb2]|nr:hypothetical protein P692DRAFT_20881006 [Suillus brevipes Sb2]